MKLCLIGVLTLCTGCSSITLVPREGKLPEVQVDSRIKGCKWRPKTDITFSDMEIYMVCKWRVSI